MNSKHDFAAPNKFLVWKTLHASNNTIVLMFIVFFLIFRFWMFANGIDETHRKYFISLIKERSIHFFWNIANQQKRRLKYLNETFNKFFQERTLFSFKCLLKTVWIWNGKPFVDICTAFELKFFVIKYLLPATNNDSSIFRNLMTRFIGNCISSVNDVCLNHIFHMIFGN